MILIADSGSTKTTWCFADKKNDRKQFILTSGINPYYQNESEILEKLKSEFIAELPDIGAVYFYGAGCTNPEVNRIVAKPLETFFGSGQIEVNTDLMAAARSLCGRNPGIACILGTGSNSCYFDGKNILNHVSPLGFILGDEGSGGVLGKTLLSDILKKQLPESIISLFFEEYKVTPDEIMENIYRKSFPNRYAAQFSRFLYQYSEKPEIRNLLTQSFRAFFTRNVLQYPEAFHYPIHFSGSIAWYFQDLLKETAVSLSLKPGKIVQDPIEGLVEYHLRSV
jgi:N-acetylglucosamine kinase-like BadF-type ATPase